MTVWSKPISIHAPQWGATLHTPRCGPLFLIFQSTHPSGVRPDQHAHDAIAQIISIHAPQWGATGRSQSAMSLIQISIHAPQWGATGRIRLGVMLLIHFNPRTPVGCDFAPLVILASGIPISIHAPQWGATEIVRRLPETVFISIHAPQWGATRNEWHHHNPQSHFNPRTPVGCDRRHATLMIV